MPLLWTSSSRSRTLPIGIDLVAILEHNQVDVRSFGIVVVLLHHRRQLRPTPAGPVVGRQPFTWKKIPRPILPPNVDGWQSS